MLSFLALGFLIGLRHALEPDHVAAVVSLSTRGGTLREQARSGAFWGIGHALTLLLLAGTCVAFGLVIPEQASQWLEGGVGLMLIVLGCSVFLRMRRSGIHVHEHEHVDGRAHFHAHGHPPEAGPGHDSHRHDSRGHDSREHRHSHPSLRSLGVGAVHGLAGSSALILLVGGAARTPGLGLAYILFFGLGAIVGMMALAATVAVPLGISARWRTGLYRWLCAGAGAGSITLGLRMAWIVAVG